MLKRNKFGDGFAKSLSIVIEGDQYLKMIDLSGNQISSLGLEMILKLGMKENNSIIAIDVRLNPGCNPKIQKYLALCMFKNILSLQNKGLTIKKSLLNPELYAFNIPLVLLSKL